MRLDVYMTENGLAPSRAKAQQMIQSGAVCVDGQTVKKPSFDVTDACEVTVESNPLQRYVGRGGLKLECALENFQLSPLGQIAIDIGASSGGFTDCLLQHGAACVYAVDSGTGQLHPTLLDDSRVISMEGVNARFLTASDFPKTPTFAVMDVSFISQTIILPAVADILAGGGTLVTLIKPQFELERALLGKNGIVKDARLHKRAVERVCACAQALGFRLVGCIESAWRGGDGNLEFLAYFTLQASDKEAHSI